MVEGGKNAFSARQQFRNRGSETFWAQRIAHKKSMIFFFFNLHKLMPFNNKQTMKYVNFFNFLSAIF